MNMIISYSAKRDFQDSFTPWSTTFLSAGNMKSLFNYTVIGAFWSLLLHSEGSPWKCVLLAGGGSKRVQDTGSVYSLEYFICGSSCFMLSEACMAVSLPGHAGILDNRKLNFFLTDYTYLFCFSSSRNTATQE